MEENFLESYQRHTPVIRTPMPRPCHALVSDNGDDTDNLHIGFKWFPLEGLWQEKTSKKNGNWHEIENRHNTSLCITTICLSGMECHHS